MKKLSMHMIICKVLHLVFVVSREKNVIHDRMYFPVFLLGDCLGLASLKICACI